jgi:hypothetical protein
MLTARSRKKSLPKIHPPLTGPNRRASSGGRTPTSNSIARPPTAIPIGQTSTSNGPTVGWKSRSIRSLVFPATALFGAYESAAPVSSTARIGVKRNAERRIDWNSRCTGEFDRRSAEAGDARRPVDEEMTATQGGISNQPINRYAEVTRGRVEDGDVIGGRRPRLVPEDRGSASPHVEWRARIEKRVARFEGEENVSIYNFDREHRRGRIPVTAPRRATGSL